MTNDQGKNNHEKDGEVNKPDVTGVGAGVGDDEGEGAGGEVVGVVVEEAREEDGGVAVAAEAVEAERGPEERVGVVRVRGEHVDAEHAHAARDVGARVARDEVVRRARPVDAEPLGRVEQLLARAAGHGDEHVRRVAAEQRRKERRGAARDRVAEVRGAQLVLAALVLVQRRAAAVAVERAPQQAARVAVEHRAPRRERVGPHPQHHRLVHSCCCCTRRRHKSCCGGKKKKNQSINLLCTKHAKGLLSSEGGMSDSEDTHTCTAESGAASTPQTHHGILKHGSTEKKKK